MQSTVQWEAWPSGWWRIAVSWGQKPGSLRFCRGAQVHESAKMQRDSNLTVGATGLSNMLTADVTPGQWCRVTLHKTLINFVQHRAARGERRGRRSHQSPPVRQRGGLNRARLTLAALLKYGFVFLPSEIRRRSGCSVWRGSDRPVHCCADPRG